MNTTLKIRDVETFTKVFRGLQRRAAALGLPVPQFDVVSSQMEEVEVYTVDYVGNTELDGKTIVKVTTINVFDTGTVAYSGWSFAGVVHAGGSDTGNVILGVPGVEFPESIRHKDPTSCDHCRTNRDRKHTYIVRHQDGGFRQIGKSCLQDFVGSNSANNLASKFEFLNTLYRTLEAYPETERGYGVRGGDVSYELVTVVAAAVRYMRDFAWIGKNRAEENGVESSSKFIRDRVTGVAKDKDFMDSIDDEDRAEAEVVIEHFRANAGDDDFSRNLHVIATAGFAPSSLLGLAIAMPISRKIAINKAEREANHDKLVATSQHVGTIGERRKFRAKVTRILEFPNDFNGGTSYNYLMVDEAGNVMVGGKMDAEVGGTYEFTGTITKHRYYQEVAQTDIRRITKVVAV
jgi:hypothetical protein